MGDVVETEDGTGAGNRGQGAGGPRFWDERYRSTPGCDLSWYQPVTTTSLALIEALGVGTYEGVVDVGGGASTLVDGLHARGYTDLTVLDVSAAALSVARARLPGAPVRWIATDVTAWTPDRRWALWHDRAAFHLLTTPRYREGYLAALDAALAPGAALIVATFAPDGPDRCSGLPVERYDADRLVSTIASRVPVDVVAERRELHSTPRGDTQAFTWIAGRRTG